MRNYITIFAMMLATSAMAQLDNTVEVTNEAKPATTNAKKVEKKAEAAETTVKHYTMEYAVQEHTLNQYTEEPIADYTTEAVRKGNKKGYIHLSGGSHGNLDGQASYQFGLTDNDALDFNLTLKGYNGKTKDDSTPDDWKSRFYRNRADLKYNHRFSNGADLFVKGGFENHVFNQSNNVVCSATDKQHNVLADFSLGLTPFKIDRLTLGATAGIDFFNQQYRINLADKLSETAMRLDASAAYNIADEHSVGLDMAARHSNYGNDELDGTTELRFTPHYIYSSDVMKIRAGVFVSTAENIAPDVSFTYHLDPTNDIYVEAVGYEEDNNLRHLTRINPYFAINANQANNIELEPRFHQLNACIGYRFRPNSSFRADINGGYDVSEHDATIYQISNNLGPALPWMEFVKSRRFYINADFVYSYSDIVRIDAKNQLNFNSSKFPDEWEKGSYVTPNFDMLWKANVKIVRGLHFGLDWQFCVFALPDAGATGGYQYDRPDILNLGASLRYTLPVDVPFTIFVKGDNLLDQQYDSYLGFRSLGANFLAGFAISF